MNEIVELICVKERNKLRVKIITPGYLNRTNTTQIQLQIQIQI